MPAGGIARPPLHCHRLRLNLLQGLGLALLTHPEDLRCHELRCPQLSTEPDAPDPLPPGDAGGDPAWSLPSRWWHRRNFAGKRHWAAGTWGIPAPGASLPLRVPRATALPKAPSPPRDPSCTFGVLRAEPSCESATAGVAAGRCMDREQKCFLLQDACETLRAPPKLVLPPGSISGQQDGH